LPATNVPLLGYEVDFLWPDARLVVEADGGSHQSRRQRDRDNERDSVLARAGHLVRRYSSTALGDPAAVAAEIAAILGERLRG
jgi:very-short-patch-repair endonuclease